MRWSVMLLATFALPATASAADKGSIVVVGHAWAPFISPMGEPFRAHSTSEDTLANWFAQADRNRDGALTADEMLADAQRFFASLDVNHDGEIDPDELVRYEWEVAPEIQLNSRWRQERGAAAAGAEKKRTADRKERWAKLGWHGGGKYDVLEGAARYALLNIPEPVAAADADFNRGVSLAEFNQAAQTRFLLLDRARQGRLGLAQLQAMKTALPTADTRPKRGKDDRDARIGVPLPRVD
jgi:Ca2+-binding EF-hand superfamily protein